MTPLKLLRKLFQVLKSQGSPTQIALGVCLGMALGLTPFGRHSLGLFSVGLVFNVSWGGVTLGLAVFKLAYFLVRPFTYQLGFFVLEDWTQLDWLWAQVFHWPLLAWMELNQYLVFGGYCLALLATPPVFALAVWSVRRYRAHYGDRIRSEKLRQLGQTWYGKLARWAAVGGEAKFQTARRRAWPLRVVRWPMLLALPAAAGLVYVVGAYAVPFLAEQLVTRPTALVLGTEVEVAEARYDPLSGRLTFSDFNVADPQHPGENLLVVGQASLDIGLVGLLQRRAVINQASVASLALHVKREADGSVNLDNVGGGWDAQGYLDWLAQHAGEVDWLGLLKNLWQYWQSRPPPAPPEPQPDLSGGRQFPRPDAWFALERIGAERFELTLVDEFGRGGLLPALRQAELVMENFELAPRYARRPMRIALSGEVADMPGARLQLGARFEPRGEGRFFSTFAVDVTDVDLAAFAPLYARTLPVDLRAGRLTLTATVQIDEGGRVAGEAALKLLGLDLQRRPDHPALFGLDPLTSEAVVQGLNRFARETPIEFRFAVGGTTEALELGWDAAFIEVAIRGLERQANALLGPTIALLKQHLQALGANGATGAPAAPLDPEAGLDALQDLLNLLGLSGDGD